MGRKCGFLPIVRLYRDLVKTVGQIYDAHKGIEIEGSPFSGMGGDGMEVLRGRVVTGVKLDGDGWRWK